MEYKLVVLGASGVGKSALTIQYTQNHFVESYEPTLEDSYRTQRVIDGESCLLDILDTSGQKEYLLMTEHQLRQGDGFLCVFSDMDSFEAVNGYIKQIMLAKGMNPPTSEEIWMLPPTILVCNKADISEGAVDSFLVQACAKFYNIPFIETSAKTGEGIELAFSLLVNIIRHEKEVTVCKKDKKCCIIL